MSNLRIDYGQLHGLVDEGKRQSSKRKRRTRRLRMLPFRVVKGAVALVVLAVLPFVLLIRGGVFAYSEWAVGTWPALLIAVASTALLLAAYAWVLTRKLGAGKGVRWILTRGAIAIAVVEPCGFSSPRLRLIVFGGGALGFAGFR